MIDRLRFKDALGAYGIVLDDEKIDLLDRYAEFLVDYNEKVNLTTITDPEGIENKHFLDSIVLRKNELVKGSVADIGSGGGFPGVVVKIVKPDTEISLMDPLTKKCVFLRSLLEKLGIEGNVIKERAEEAARKQYRESFDVATARAVADLRVLSEYCLPLVKVGGWFIAMKANRDEEIARAKPAMEKLGGRYVGTEEYFLPDGSRRCLVICRKERPTPPQYPRNGGKIAKSPL